MLKENNERNRVLSPEEYAKLIAACPEHLKPLVKLAHYTGMRLGEILGLTWGQVDLKDGFIRLTPRVTKTREAVIPGVGGDVQGHAPGVAGTTDIHPGG